MKQIAILLLALLFVHGGVVWAMSDCLAVHDHHSALVSEQRADSHDSSEPVIHCPPVARRIWRTFPSPREWGSVPDGA
jgi:hypothetical protein